MDQFTAQNELSKALENLRNATERAAKLERENARLLEMVFQFAPAARKTVTVNDDGIASVWEWPTSINQSNDDGVVSVAPAPKSAKIAIVNDDGTTTVHDFSAEFETRPSPSTVSGATQYTLYEGRDSLPFTPDQPAQFPASSAVLPAEYNAVPQSSYQATGQRVQRQRVNTMAVPPAPSVDVAADRISDGAQASPASE